MVKRVSCRVVSSVPFSKMSADLLFVRQPSNHQYKIGETDTTVVRPKIVINPARNPDVLIIASETLDFPIGQILDYYA